MGQRTCIVDGCEKPARKRCRRCAAHQYHHEKLTHTRSCSIEGCGRKHLGQGFCAKHLRNWRVNGDPLAPSRRGKVYVGPLHYNWSGENASYQAVHKRMRRAKGDPTRFDCPCGRQAQQWAYDHMDPDERTDLRTGCVYSIDFDRYAPMCRKCHRALDHEHGRQK